MENAVLEKPTSADARPMKIVLSSTMVTHATVCGLAKKVHAHSMIRRFSVTQMATASVTMPTCAMAMTPLATATPI